MSTLIRRLARPHPSGGFVIERAAILGKALRLDVRRALGVAPSAEAPPAAKPDAPFEILDQATARHIEAALARTAGTCMGDWLAENRMLHLGLPLSTGLTGAAFVTILTLWPGTRREAPATA